MAICAMLAFGLVGCGSVYQQRAAEFEATQPVSAWGRKPPEFHRQAEIASIKGALFDPYTADIREGSLARYVLPESFSSPVPVAVWGSQILVNAKNRFGAYVGFKTHYFFYRDGALFATQDGDGIRRWAGQASSGEGLQSAASDLRRQLGQPAVVHPQAVTSQGSAPTAAIEPAPPAASTAQKTSNGTQRAVGQESYQVARMAEVKACNPNPDPVLVTKTGASLEFYTVACAAGGAIAVNCEWGSCRVMK